MQVVGSRVLVVLRDELQLRLALVIGKPKCDEGLHFPR